MTHPPDKPALRRVLRVKDLVFFYVTAVLGMRWVATAAASGPSALLIWVLAAPLRSPRLHRHRTFVALSGRGRGVRLDQARVR